MQRIWTSILAGSMAATSPVMAAPVVKDVRLGQHPDRTRVVVDLTESTGYELIPEDNGRRLIIELPETEWPETEWNEASAQVEPLGLVDRVTRFRRASGAGLRIVLDFGQEATVASDFFLKPDAGRPHRLVVDVMDVETAANPPALEDGARVSDPDVLKDAADMAGTKGRARTAAPADVAAIEALEPVFPDFSKRDPAVDAPPILENPAADDAAAPPTGRTGPVMMMAEAGEEGAPPPSLDDAPPPISLDGVRQDWSGYIESEIRLFPTSVPGKKDVDGSLAAELRYEATWDNGMHSVTLVPFGRVDINDGSRTHADIRELKWVGVFGNVEMRLGADRVFWGVTESVHLVNVINQIDNVEDIDEEDLLGQPMASLSWSQSFGTFTAFFLPYFRERTFPGPDGRPGRYLVADDMASFGSPHDDWRTDWAVRYAHAIGPFDIGLAHFHGMGRDPLLIPTVVGTETVLVPRYDPIDQSSIDLQATFGALLLKFEGIAVDGPAAPWGERYYAAAGGFEYTFFNIFGGRSDLGILSEYLWDDRDDLSPVPFEDDLFVGMRWSGNNARSTELLAGAIFDMDGDAVAANVEASHRLWRQWRLSLDARLFLDVDSADPLYFYAQDDFLQLRLDRFF